MYQVLARKWRPQNFEELVGQRHVAKTLANAIGADRLAHAYIFAGLRGSGKTTVARIVAKCLNCEQGPTTTPCDRCDACREIAASRAMDVLEIDAASRTKVEQTRELLEVVSYAPVRDRYKILIIDEAHMLSKASFNALLKTLEEPPPNVVFMLATTEIQKVLPTILSRCQVFEFRRVVGRELAEHLRRICEREKIDISDASVERIARAGEGSVRDSLSVLERVLAFCGNTVEDDDVLRLLGGVRAEVLAEMMRGLATRDARVMLEVLDGLTAEGHDLVHFWTELLAALRDLLLAGAVPDAAGLLSRSAEETAALQQAGQGLSTEDLTRAFQILADLEPALKSSSQPRFMFETTLIRLASLGAVRPIEELLQSLGSVPESRAAAAPQKKKPVAGVRPRATVSRDAPAREEALPAAGTAVDAGGGGGLRERLIAGLLERRPMIGAIVQQASAVELSDDTLTLAFPDTLKAQVRPLERKESLALVAGVAERLAGRRVTVRLDFGESAVPPDRRVAQGAPAPAAREREAAERQRGGTPLGGPAPEGRGSLMRRATGEPGVKKLLREFGAQVVDIRPLDAPRKPGDAGPMEES